MAEKPKLWDTIADDIALALRPGGMLRERELEDGTIIGVVPLLGARGRITRGPDRLSVDHFW